VTNVMQQYQNYFEANKALWNQRTTVHKDSSFYDVPSFMKGKNSLTPIELNELGDVTGKKILHLQCHFGMDSLSLARMGAEVTGVDLSDEAISEARHLNEQLGLNAKFICCNVYDLPKHLDEKFDIVFNTYGVVGWLPDLETWAQMISRYLKPGGYFYLAEFHPVIWMFDDDFTHIKYYYQNRELIETDSTGTYTNRDAPIAAKEYSWNHSLSEVINSLLSAGLELEFLNEYSYSPYPCFNKVV
ncbi:MAG TPA: class I SAM-dependent methyltransferase, partial [Chitinophagaceae bacterium]